MSKTRKLTRHEARELTFKLLFAKEFDKEAESGAFCDAFIENTESLTNDYVKSTFVGVCEALTEIDGEIEGASAEWKLSRMSTATRSILRLATYELLKTDTPAKVVLNEAIEIIKLYDETSAPVFVNGILNHIAKTHDLFAPQTAE